MRLVAVLVLAMLGPGALGLAVTLPAPNAAADPLAQCTTTSGVVVAVDFSHWGGNVERGCDATLTTGYDALHAAGFTTAGDGHDGPAFICRIDNEPPPTEDPCITTPPSTAYWSYWHANAGQDSWSYSPFGAVTYQPQPGSVDAWVFGATNVQGSSGQPTFAPNAVRALNSAPTGPVTATTLATATAPAAVGGAGGAAPSAGTAKSPSPSGPSSPSSPTGTGAAQGSGANSPTISTTNPSAGTKKVVPSTGDSRGRSGSSPGPRVMAVSPTSTRASSTFGSPVALGVGAALAALIAGGAGLIAWRRRQSTHLGEG